MPKPDSTLPTLATRGQAFSETQLGNQGAEHRPSLMGVRGVSNNTALNVDKAFDFIFQLRNMTRERSEDKGPSLTDVSEEVLVISDEPRGPVLRNGCFVAPTFQSYTIGDTSSFPIDVVDEVRAWKFTLPGQVGVTRFATYREVVVAGAHYSVGIYTTEGKRIFHSGVIDAGAAIGADETELSRSIVLNGGMYYLVMTADDANIRMLTISAAPGVPSLAQIYYDMLNSFEPVWSALSSNSSSGGALPQSLGTLSATPPAGLGNTGPPFVWLCDE